MLHIILFGKGDFVDIRLGMNFDKISEVASEKLGKPWLLVLRRLNIVDVHFLYWFHLLSAVFIVYHVIVDECEHFDDCSFIFCFLHFVNQL